MRHRVGKKKLGRKTAHRVMMLRNLVTSFLDKERIRTTLPRAKALRPVAEQMITLGKRESLHARRRALSFIKDPAVVAKLFSTIAPRFAERPGGYTRIVRLGFRDGDGAQMAVIELVGSEYKSDKAEESKKAGRKAAKSEKPEKETPDAAAKSAAAKDKSKKAKAAGEKPAKGKPAEGKPPKTRKKGKVEE